MPPKHVQMAWNQVQEQFVMDWSGNGPLWATENHNIGLLPTALPCLGPFWAMFGPHTSCIASETKKWPYIMQHCSSCDSRPVQHPTFDGFRLSEWPKHTPRPEFQPVATHFAPFQEPFLSPKIRNGSKIDGKQP